MRLIPLSVFRIVRVRFKSEYEQTLLASNSVLVVHLRARRVGENPGEITAMALWRCESEADSSVGVQNFPRSLQIIIRTNTSCVYSVLVVHLCARRVRENPGEIAAQTLTFRFV